MIVSEFTSNEDLFKTCIASSSIPFVSEPSWGYMYRGRRVVDGGMTDNTPVFKDQLRRQLVLRTSSVTYPFRCVMRPTDICIEALVVRGAINMARFLQGRPCDNIIHFLAKVTQKRERERGGKRKEEGQFAINAIVQR